MALSTVSILDAASATRNMETFLNAATVHQQTVREVRSSAGAAATSWTVTTAGLTNVVAADTSRLKLLIVSMASNRVYLNHSATIPTSVLFNWFLDPGDRWEVPSEESSLAWSAIGGAAGGFVLFSGSTAA